LAAANIPGAGRREASLDPPDFHHNESQLFGIDRLKCDFAALDQILGAYYPAPMVETLTPAARSGGSASVSSGAAVIDLRNVSPMTAFFISLLMGLVVGVVYGLSGVRSPAPPLIALLGLFGIVVGEQAVVLMKTHFFAPRGSMRQTTGRAIDERRCRSLN
jgi:XapX domain-containing protein